MAKKKGAQPDDPERGDRLDRPDLGGHDLGQVRAGMGERYKARMSGLQPDGSFLIDDSFKDPDLTDEEVRALEEELRRSFLGRDEDDESSLLDLAQHFQATKGRLPRRLTPQELGLVEEIRQAFGGPAVDLILDLDSPDLGRLIYEEGRAPFEYGPLTEAEERAVTELEERAATTDLIDRPREYAGPADRRRASASRMRVLAMALARARTVKQ